MLIVFAKALLNSTSKFGALCLSRWMSVKRSITLVHHLSITSSTRLKFHIKLLAEQKSDRSLSHHSFFLIIQQVIISRWSRESRIRIVV